MKKARLLIFVSLSVMMLPYFLCAGSNVKRTLDYKLFSFDAYVYVSKHFKIIRLDKSQLQQVAMYNEIVRQFDTALIVSCHLIIADKDSIEQVEYRIGNDMVSFSGSKNNAALRLKNIALSEGETYFIHLSYRNSRQRIVEVDYDPYNISVLQLVQKDTSGAIIEQHSIRKQKI